jgi:predicted aspartyl protease
MPALEERISDDGPLIPVGIGLSALQATAARLAGFSPPPPELARALIDTGAGVTCIDSKIARALDLRTTGTARMWTAGETVTRAVYDIEVTLTLPRLFRVPSVIRALEADLWVHGFQVLIGRDVLRHCRFTYNGPAEIFTLDY